MKELFKFLTYMFIFQVNQGCLREATCEEAASAYRPDSMNIIVLENSQSAYKLELNGINPQTKLKTVIRRQNYTWAQWFIDDISIGDTVVKKRGELKFYIHKKDTVLVFPFECDGKIIE